MPLEPIILMSAEEFDKAFPDLRPKCPKCGGRIMGAVKFGTCLECGAMWDSPEEYQWFKEEANNGRP